MRLYFDNNVYNRPFDDRSIPRNRAEARTVEDLFERVISGDIELVSSFVVELEHSRVRYFVTCDDRLLGRAQQIGLPVSVVSPLELPKEETP